MKTTVQIVIASSLALIGGLSAEEGKKPTRPPKLPPEIIAKFNKDGDGSLNQEERDAAMAARKEIKKMMIAKFDKDGDGKLNEDEKTAMREHRKKMALERFDKDRDGALSADEKAEMKKEMGKFRGKGSSIDKEALGAGI